ncbi:MAG TPA: tetratricopeptide repeat protein [Burkholderiaceae bacterium]|jgi:predicted O-linked N-acetylglucosamine transferase (SPINDLY family)|nr:tetratricopeptide repeat protein [Burkholderiaceae bacterium]
MPPPNIFQRPAPRPAAPAGSLVAFDVQRALMLHQSGQVAQAAEIYAKVLQSVPDQFECLHYLGVAHVQRGTPAQALPLLERALALRAGDASLQSNHGLALLALGRHAAALASLDRALALRPGMAEALNSKGWALRALHRLEEALACLDQALKANPKFVEAQQRRAIVLGELGRDEEALAAFERLLALRPDDADALGNLGTLLTRVGRTADARAALARAIALAPRAMTHRIKHAVAWLPLVRAADEDLAPGRAAFEREVDAMLADAQAGPVAHPEVAVGAAQPFYIAYQELDNVGPLSRYGRLCAALMALWAAAQPAAAPSPAAATARVRVGIASSHIFAHSVWQAIVRGWVEELDRERFEVVVFHLGHTHDAETAFARERAQEFVSGARSLADWVAAIRDARLDVLIYPELGMDALTPRLAALRLAPVQVASWGHPETTGLPTLDHYLSAERFESAEADAHYSEALVRLPGLGCCVAPAAVRPADQAAAVTRAELGVRDDATLIVCGGTPFKYTPEHDAVLVRIAQQVPAAQFLFFRNAVAAPLTERLMARLAAAFEAHGLDPAAHLVLAPWLERSRFFGVLLQAQLFLDSVGFSGFNTVMQAVECGLPVVTQRGRFMRGRLGSGILEHLGLDDLVAADDDAMVALAVSLARDAQARADVRERLLARREAMYGDLAPIRALEEHLQRWAGRS